MKQFERLNLSDQKMNKPSLIDLHVKLKVTRNNSVIKPERNHYTRMANNLQPENKIVIGWNAERSAKHKLPKTFKNFDKDTLRQIDGRKTQTFLY